MPGMRRHYHTKNSIWWNHDSRYYPHVAKVQKKSFCFTILTISITAKMSVFAMQWEEGKVIENYLIKLNKILFQSQVYKFIFFQDHAHVSQERICAFINFGLYIHTHCLNCERKMKPKSDQDYLRGKLSHATEKISI